MKTKFLIILVIVFAFSINTTFAQGCEDEVASGTKSGAPTTSSMTVFGYIQPQYTANFTDDGTNTFDFKRARIGVRGRINRSFSYYVMLEASPFISGADANLYDAFITWDKNEWYKVSLGSFKQPFGRDVTTACHSLTTVDRSIVADQLVAPQRDMGIMLLGGSNKTKFRYSLALMNGRGLFYEDNNQKKDIIGRATYQVFDFLNVGASFRNGFPTNDEEDRNSYGFDFLANYKDFNLQGEYIYDKGDFNSAAGGGCGSTDPMTLSPDGRQGGYLMAWYNVSKKFQPVLKYEYFDGDLDKKNRDDLYDERMTFGFNYFFTPKTRLQVNYQANIETNVNEDNDALIMQLQVRF